MIEQFCNWLSVTRVSLALQSAEWFVPLVQTIHIVCIAVLLIPLLHISEALLRGYERIQLSAVITVNARRAWPLLLVLLTTGILLTITEPSRELLNWVFRTKMVLVAVLAGFIGGLAIRGRRGSVALGRGPAVAAGVVIIVLAVAIVTAGRWIAYT